MPDPVTEQDLQEAMRKLRASRGKDYGSVEFNHGTIGLMWQGLLEQHFQQKLPGPIPAYLVALMMATVKLNRTSFKFKQDNYDDAHTYLQIAHELQTQGEQKEGDQ